MNEKKETEQVSGENVPETPQLPPKKTKESFLPEGSAKEKFFYIVKTAILIAVSASTGWIFCFRRRSEKSSMEP